MSTSSEESNDNDVVYDYKWQGNSNEQYIFSYGKALDPKFSNPSIAGYYRPWRFIDKKNSGISRIFYARSKEFRIALDVSQFSPENIVVKLVGDVIVVEARHPIIVDYLGQVRRQLVRKYRTPPDLKLDTISCKHKRGLLILWGDRNFEPAEKPVIDILADDDVDEVVVSRKEMIGSLKCVQPGKSENYDNTKKLGGKLKTDKIKGTLFDVNSAIEKNSSSDAEETEKKKEIIIQIQKSSLSPRDSNG